MRDRLHKASDDMIDDEEGFVPTLLRKWPPVLRVASGMVMFGIAMDSHVSNPALQGMYRLPHNTSMAAIATLQGCSQGAMIAQCLSRQTHAAVGVLCSGLTAVAMPM